MTAFGRHIVHQHRVIASLGGVALRALLQLRSLRARAADVPGPELRVELPPPPPSLIRDYVTHVGGSANDYAQTIPPHLFPHWGMPLAAKTLRGLPYPLLRIVNAGCRLEVHAPLVAGEPLIVSARLESVDDDGRRAVLHQRIVTEQRSRPRALVAHVQAFVPLARRSREPAARKSRELERIPADAEPIDGLTVGSRAGLDFALLTGDFNPVHWVRPYARALGHPSTILHGFATMARVYESLQRSLVAKDLPRIRTFEVRFVRPLVLPASLGVYRRGDALFVGRPGELALVTGSYVAGDEQDGSSPPAHRREEPSDQKLELVS